MAKAYILNEERPYWYSLTSKVVNKFGILFSKIIRNEWKVSES